jgi:hypothetical protein
MIVPLSQRVEQRLESHRCPLVFTFSWGPSLHGHNLEGFTFPSQWIEFKTGTERKEAIENTLLTYKSPRILLRTKLAPTHPIRLGLALNFSVFYYEIVNSPDRACNLAKQAVDESNGIDDGFIH